MSYNSLRKGRLSINGQLYFVTTVLNGRKPWFKDFYLARQIVLSMREIENEGHLLSHAWVMMPDHLHWLFQLGNTQSLSNVVGLFKGRTARKANEYTNRKGRFWQSSFPDYALRKDDDVRKYAKYIIANPLRAGLVDNIGDYPHWDATWL